MLLGRQVLLAEEDHPVAVKGVANFGKLLVSHFGSEVDPEDLRPHHSREGLDLDGPIPVSSFHACTL